MNRIIISGRLVKEPETSYGAQTQKAFTRLRIAVRENQDKTFFINVKAWDKTAEMCEHFTVGQFITVDGRLHENEYEKDQKIIRTMEVFAERIETAPQKKEKPEQKEEPADFQALDEEVPF